MDVLAEHIELRLATYRRHPFFVDGPAARRKVTELLTKLHEEGHARVHRGSGRLDAVIAWRRDDESWFGPPVYTIAIDHREGLDVQGWLEASLAATLPTIGDADWDLLLDAHYPQAYRALVRLGAGVDSVQLVGDVETALRRLDPGALPDGVSIERMRLEDLDPIVSLYGETFRAEPEYCWFGAHPRWMKKQREIIEEHLAEEGHVELVLRTADGVRGHASGSVDPENAFWGPTGGMSLCFAPELRGRGALRPVYRRLLEGMRARGAKHFRGGTSQPAVIKLGREMGRDLQGPCMRRRPHFGEAHFAPYLPLG